MGDWTIKIGSKDSCYSVELDKIKVGVEFSEIKDDTLRCIFTKTLDKNGDKKLSEDEVKSAQKELSDFASPDKVISDSKLVEYLKSKQVEEENMPTFKKILKLITNPIKEKLDSVTPKDSIQKQIPDTTIAKQPNTKVLAKLNKKKGKSWNNYTVQLGEKIDDIVRRGLESKGITNPTEKEFESAKRRFLNMNSDSIKYTKDKEAYVYAGEKILVDGKLKDLNNKQDVIKKYLALKQQKNSTIKYNAENCRPTYCKDIVYDEVNKTHFKKVDGKWVELLGQSGEKITFVAKDGSYRSRRNLKNGKWIKSYYSKDGTLDKEFYINSNNKVTGYNTFSYSTSNNKLTKSTYYTRHGVRKLDTQYYFNGKPLQETVYNDNGSIAKDKTYSRNGKSVVVINNANGIFKRKEEFDERNRLCKTEDNAGISNFKYLNNGKHISEYISKENSNGTERYLCDSEGNKLYACDSNGRKLNSKRQVA